MRKASTLLLCLVFLQVFMRSAFAAKSHQSCPLSPELEEKCSRHTYQVTRTMFLYFEKVNKEIEEHSEELKSRDNRIKQLEERETELERELEIKSNQVENLQIENTIYKSKEDSMVTVLKEFKRQQTLIEQLATNQCQREIEEIEQLKSQITSKGENLGKCEAELTNHKETIVANTQKMNQTKAKVNESLDKVEEKNAKSCIDRDSSGVLSITLSNDYTFEVLCNSDIAGPGWTVIQQRIDGEVDFYRNWDTYRDGFGDFWDGEFFLGLEKIHRLTAEKPQELYIYMERFNGSSYYARYDEFAIAGEDDQYRLIKLGEFSGSAKNDMMSKHENMKFSTYDRDNDDSNFFNCAKYNHGGWWYRNCANSNLNGRYYPTEVENEDTIYWKGITSLKQVKMMIRSKVTSK